MQYFCVCYIRARWPLLAERLLNADIRELTHVHGRALEFKKSAPMYRVL